MFFFTRHQVDAKRIYREMFILRHMRHEEIINLKNVIMPATYDDFRDLYLVRALAAFACTVDGIQRIRGRAER